MPIRAKAVPFLLNYVAGNNREFIAWRLCPRPALAVARRVRWWVSIAREMTWKAAARIASLPMPTMGVVPLVYHVVADNMASLSMAVRSPRGAQLAPSSINKSVGIAALA